MNDVVNQENRLCPIILGHIYIWKIVKLSDFLFLQGGGTPQSNTQFCDFTGWRNMCMMWYIKKICCDQSF